MSVRGHEVMALGEGYKAYLSHLEVQILKNHIQTTLVLLSYP